MRQQKIADNRRRMEQLGVQQVSLPVLPVHNAIGVLVED